MNGFTLQINISSLDELKTITDKLGLNNAMSEQPIMAAPSPAAPMPDQPEPIHQQPATPPQPAIPTQTTQYTFDQLAPAAAAFARASQQNQTAVLSLLEKYGVNGLASLPQEHYGAFATELRQLGVQI